MQPSIKEKLEAKIFQDVVNSKQNWVKKLQAERNQTKLDGLRDSIMGEVHAQIKIHPALKLTPLQREEYKTIGGTPHLDAAYTVFGEVVEGMDIVESISMVKTGRNDRPVEDVKIIRATVLK